MAKATEDEINIELLNLLLDLDNLIADMAEPIYKKIGFQIEDDATLSLMRKRNELMQKIPRELRELYERLKKRYHRAIFATVEEGFCRGCFQKLPTELLTKTKEIITCPNCGRIIYWQKK